MYIREEYLYSFRVKSSRAEADGREVISALN
jgi:hypothetical protein